MLPRMSVFTMFPAMRIEKMSPSPWSKMSSADVRLSMHERMVANGHCPSRVSLACLSSSRLSRRFATKRSLPSRSSSSARRGVVLAWVSLECAFISSPQPPEAGGRRCGARGYPCCAGCQPRPVSAHSTFIGSGLSVPAASITKP